MAEKERKKEREREGKRGGGDSPEIRFITLHKARVEMALMMFMFHVCGLMKGNDYPRQQQHSTTATRQQQDGNSNTATLTKNMLRETKQID